MSRKLYLPRRSKFQLVFLRDDSLIFSFASRMIDFEGIFKQFYKNGMSDYVVEIETPEALREKKNADGSKYTSEQISDEVFEAARKSAEYLKKAKFVK